MPPVYGTAPDGDHHATLVGVETSNLGRGSRLLYQFLLLNADCAEARYDDDGNPVFAITACNVSSGTNPKSKPFRLNRAMLEADEFDPIDSAVRVPPWQHFCERRADGQRRVIGVRVAGHRFANGRVALVTHIRRPRDGVWESIEGRFEGAVPAAGPRVLRPAFLNPDKSFRRLSPQQLRSLTEDEYELYNACIGAMPDADQRDPFWMEDGRFRVIDRATYDTLSGGKKGEYLRRSLGELGQASVP